MATINEIANMALDRIGQTILVSIDDPSPSAEVCKRNIYQAIRETLEMGTWKCARKQANLPQLTGEPTYGWTLAYQLPSDYLKMVLFNNHPIEAPNYDLYEIQGGKILTDETVVTLTYVADLTANENDVGLMTPLLANLCGLNLAAKVAWNFQQSNTQQQNLQAEFERKVKRAAFKDTLENGRSPLPNPLNSSTWLYNRLSSTAG